MKPLALLVDDKPNFLSLLTKVLRNDFRLVTARGVAEAQARLREGPPDVVVCDLRMPDGDGLEVLRSLRGLGLRCPFILMTAYATVPTAVQAMREGAYDYVTKPFDPDELRTLVLRAVGEARVVAAGDEAAPPARPSVPPAKGVEAFAGMIGRSQAMRELYRIVERMAPTDATVLVLGETGTGKALVARAIHDRSPRASNRCVAVNCAAIPRALMESELFGHMRGSFTGADRDRAGLFEEASGSTLFLDEIGELRSGLQAKLTRVLEERAVRRVGDSKERKVDVRLVAATHCDLQEMVRGGQFREDLWYRLNVCALTVPPLRDRREDIPLLAHHFLATRAPRGPQGFTAEAMRVLCAHAWPGNVRELRSAVERAAILAEGDRIDVAELPTEVRGAPALPQAAGGRALVDMTYREAMDTTHDEVARRYLEALLTLHAGNVSAAAQHAGVERESFHRLLRRHDLRAEQFRSDGRDAPGGQGNDP
ncbi:MAG: sigma-54 dependent transcriptional regulator [Deltaproteobacteria bacterium]|nr:sigma-54 dependent transcriptional regulator [Deltaproteobacteria bacterium]